MPALPLAKTFKPGGGAVPSGGKGGKEVDRYLLGQVCIRRYISLYLQVGFWDSGNLMTSTFHIFITHAHHLYNNYNLPPILPIHLPVL